MKRQHSFAFLEMLKSVAIFLLIVLMLVLVILLVLGQSSGQDEILPLADRMVVYASGVQSKYASGMDTARVSPYMIAYRSDGGDMRVLHASDAAERPYEALYPLLRDAFGSSAVGIAMEEDRGAQLWAACADMTELIYVRYNGELPCSVIRAYTYSEEDGEGISSVLDERVNGVSAYVKELFLVPTEYLRQLIGEVFVYDPFEICALTRDGDGAITLFLTLGSAEAASAVSVPTEVSSESESAEAHPVRTASLGVLAAYIASMEALSQGGQTGSFAVADYAHGTAVDLHGSYHMPQIVRTPYDPTVSLYADEEKLTAVLGLLGLRENDTKNYYTDGAGDRIYLNASGRLTVSGSTSSVRYVSLQEGGLDLSDYLGYASLGGDYLLSEYLRASDKLLSQLQTLDPAFGGGALVCTLTDVAIDADRGTDTLVLTYGYTYRGIPLIDDNGAILPAMVLRAGNGVISELELYLCNAEIAQQEQYLLPQDITRKALALESERNGEEPQCLSMAYLCEETNGYGAFSADWISLLH